MDHANIECKQCKGIGWTGLRRKKTFCNKCHGRGSMSWIDIMMGRANEDGMLIATQPIEIKEDWLQVIGLHVKHTCDTALLIRDCKYVRVQDCYFEYIGGK